jgi:hypothetical protein
VGPTIGFGLDPDTAFVLDLHMHIGIKDLATNREGPDARQAVENCIARELRNDEASVIGQRTVSKVIPHPVPSTSD